MLVSGAVVTHAVLLRRYDFDWVFPTFQLLLVFASLLQVVLAQGESACGLVALCLRTMFCIVYSSVQDK